MTRIVIIRNEGQAQRGPLSIFADDVLSITIDLDVYKYNRLPVLYVTTSIDGSSRDFEIPFASREEVDTVYRAIFKTQLSEGRTIVDIDKILLDLRNGVKPFPDETIREALDSFLSPPSAPVSRNPVSGPFSAAVESVAERASEPGSDILSPRRSGTSTM